MNHDDSYRAKQYNLSYCAKQYHLYRAEQYHLYRAERYHLYRAKRYHLYRAKRYTLYYNPYRDHMVAMLPWKRSYRLISGYVDRPMYAQQPRVSLRLLLSLLVLTGVLATSLTFIWIVTRKRRKFSIGIGSNVKGPYKFVTSMMSVGDDPRKKTTIWKVVGHDPDGRIRGTVEKSRDVTWNEVCIEDKSSWSRADRILIDSNDPKDECNDPTRNEDPTDLPSINQCPAALVNLASKFLARLGQPLNDKDVTNAMYASDDPVNGMFIYRVQSDENLLYTDATVIAPREGTLEYERLNSTMNRVISIYNHYGIKEFDLALSSSTVPICMRRDQTIPNVFNGDTRRLRYLSMTRCMGTNMLPVLEWSESNYGPFDKWDAKMKIFRTATRRVPWERRKDQAIFQGPIANFICEPNGYQTLGMHDCLKEGVGRLKNLSKSHPDKLEVIYTGAPNGWDCVKPEKGLLPSELAISYRYIVIADRECGWTPELRQYLFSGSTILLKTMQCREYYQFIMEPWVHYVPWEYDTLLDRINWLGDNQEKARVIAQNALSFAEAYLTQRSMLCWESLILGQATLAAKRPFVKLATLAENIITGIEHLESSSSDEKIEKY